MQLSEMEMVLRLVLSAIFGAAIGLERERKNWSAGMRTHMMVSVGSCLIMLISAYGFAEHKNLDPSRMAAQVISGIGFLGAGTILFLKQGVIRGLTTASGLWTVAAIGLGTGAGMYFAAGITTAISLLILYGLQSIESKWIYKIKQKNLRITLGGDPLASEALNELLLHKQIETTTYAYHKKTNETIVEIHFGKVEGEELKKIAASLQADEAVKEVYWQS